MKTIDESSAQTTAEGHRLDGQPCPSTTGERNVAELVAGLVAECHQSGQLRVELERDIRCERIPPLVQGNVFRIVQEALTNVRQHSRSKRAKIKLWQREKALLVEIEDWGVGFDPNGVSPKCCGLKRIRQRARLSGGRASIQSAPGEGTRILVELPGIVASRKRDVV